MLVLRGAGPRRPSRLSYPALWSDRVTIGTRASASATPTRRPRRLTATGSRQHAQIGQSRRGARGDRAAGRRWRSAYASAWREVIRRRHAGHQRARVKDWGPTRTLRATRTTSWPNSPPNSGPSVRKPAREGAAHGATGRATVCCSWSGLGASRSGGVTRSSRTSSGPPPAAVPVDAAEPARTAPRRRLPVFPPAGRSLRFEFKVPGEHAVLLRQDGHVSAHPELVVRLLAPAAGAGHQRPASGRTLRRVAPVAAGRRCTVELAALGGRGKPASGASTPLRRRARVRRRRPLAGRRGDAGRAGPVFSCAAGSAQVRAGHAGERTHRRRGTGLRAARGRRGLLRQLRPAAAGRAPGHRAARRPPLARGARRAGPGGGADRRPRAGRDELRAPAPRRDGPAAQLARDLGQPRPLRLQGPGAGPEPAPRRRAGAMPGARAPFDLTPETNAAHPLLPGSGRNVLLVAWTRCAAIGSAAPAGPAHTP